MKKKELGYKVTILTLLMGIAIVHLLKISQVMPCFNVDELGMGYDVWSLKNFGYDRYGNSYPLYLTNYGGGQSVLYAYLCYLVLHLCKFSLLAVRLPAVICVCISAIYVFRICNLFTDMRRCRSIFALLVLMVSPVYIMLFRIGMDCNLMLAIASMLLFYGMKASLTGKTKYYVLFGLSAGVILYSYAMSYVIVLVYLACIFLYLLWSKQITVKNTICFLIPLILLAAPLIAIQLINMFDLPEVKLGPFTLTKLISYRASEISIKNLKPYTIKLFLRNLLWADDLRYNSVTEFGVMYVISIPFLIIGVIKGIIVAVKSIRKRELCLEVFYVVWFMIIAMLSCMLYSNVNRMNGIYLASLLFVCDGIVAVAGIFKNCHMKNIYFAAVGAIYIVFFALFSRFYYGGTYTEKYQPAEFCADSLQSVFESVEESNLTKGKQIYVYRFVEPYMYYVTRDMDHIMKPTEYFVTQDASGEFIIREDYSASFGNIHFYIPEEIDKEAVYIFPVNITDEITRFISLGFISSDEIGGYKVLCME